MHKTVAKPAGNMVKLKCLAEGILLRLIQNNISHVPSLYDTIAIEAILFTTKVSLSKKKKTNFKVDPVLDSYYINTPHTLKYPWFSAVK